MFETISYFYTFIWPILPRCWNEKDWTLSLDVTFLLLFLWHWLGLELKLKTLKLWLCDFWTFKISIFISWLHLLYTYPVMDLHGGPYLNMRALCSPLGAARLCQLATGCAAIAMVTHSAGYSGSQGVFCMAAWCFCFAMSVLVFFLDATRLYSFLPISWDNLTVTCAAFATLM